MREFFHFVQLRPENFGGLEPHAHFQSWLQSFSVAARATTGEAWHKIMYDVMTDADGCQDLFNISVKSIQEYQSNLTFEEKAPLSDGVEFGVCWCQYTCVFAFVCCRRCLCGDNLAWSADVGLGHQWVPLSFRRPACPQLHIFVHRCDDERVPCCGSRRIRGPVQRTERHCANTSIRIVRRRMVSGESP